MLLVVCFGSDCLALVLLRRAKDDLNAENRARHDLFEMRKAMNTAARWMVVNAN